MIVTVHRGTREIGGNCCIEVPSPSTRLVLDVGLPLVNEQREPFDSFKAIRSSREQLIADGTIKPVPGLFTDESPAPDAILLSHARLDHVGLLHHSRPEIPIYATTGTSKIMLAGGIFANRTTRDRNRRRAIKPGTSFAVGDFTITPFAVDHSTFGCLAFRLEAGGKRLIYSGDLRRHGRKPGMIRTLIERIAPRNVDVLLAEVGGDFIPAHASGHTYTSDLRELVNALNPETVIPTHTFEPGMFGEFFPDVQVLRDGDPLAVSTTGTRSVATDIASRIGCVKIREGGRMA